MTGNPHTWKEYYFSVYSFSLCNTALFGSHALAYPASISTSSRCLTVPMQIFDHIAGWIPLECPDSDASGHTQLCWLGKVHVPSLSHCLRKVPHCRFRWKTCCWAKAVEDS